MRTEKELTRKGERQTNKQKGKRAYRKKGIQIDKRTDKQTERDS